MPRLAVYALIVCALSVVAAVVSFVEGSWLGIVWIAITGLTSNMCWYYARKARIEKAAAVSAAGSAD